MMTPKQYLTAVQEAFDRTRAKTHDLTGKVLPDAEELVAQLAGRGLLIVEAPVGVETDFRGVPRQALEQ